MCFKGAVEKTESDKSVCTCFVNYRPWWVANGAASNPYLAIDL